MKSDKLYIGHILDAISGIEEYTANISFEEFLKDRKTQDAVLRKLEVIGEASKRLSDDLTKSAAEIPWKDIVGMRNKLIHDYFGVDLEEVWKTAKEDIIALKSALEKYQNISS